MSSTSQSQITDFFHEKKSRETERPSKNDSSKAQFSREKSPSKTATKPAPFPKQLGADEVRQRLGTVRNLTQLRQRLETFSAAAARLNKEREEVMLAVQAVERSAHEMSPVKAPPPTSEPAVVSLLAEEGDMKTPDKEQPFVPAHERYAHLVSTSADLELPGKYARLMETFRATDQIVSMRYNRNEMITFDKLKEGVQRITCRNFDVTHLGQIKTIYEEAYSFEQIKLSTKFSDDNPHLEKFFLTLAPNLDTDLKNLPLDSPNIKTPVKRRLNMDDIGSSTPRHICSPTKRSSPCKSPWPTPGSPHIPLATPMSGTRLIRRAEVFRRNLYSLLRMEHKKFLSTLTPPIELTPKEEAELKRWHPEFPLDSLADIAVAALPLPPTVDKIYSAKEMLRQTASVGTKFPNKVEEALRSTALKEDNAVLATTSMAAVRKKCLAGIPADVLEKVRAKQAQRQQRTMHSNSEEQIKLQRLQRLPDMVRIIKGFFDTENKNVLPFDVVCKKLFESYCRSSISLADIEQHVNILIALAPSWLTKTFLRDKGSYLRLDKHHCISEVLSKIQAATTTPR